MAEENFGLALTQTTIGVRLAVVAFTSSGISSEAILLREVKAARGRTDSDPYRQLSSFKHASRNWSYETHACNSFRTVLKYASRLSEHSAVTSTESTLVIFHPTRSIDIGLKFGDTLLIAHCWFGAVTA